MENAPASQHAPTQREAVQHHGGCSAGPGAPEEVAPPDVSMAPVAAGVARIDSGDGRTLDSWSVVGDRHQGSLRSRVNIPPRTIRFNIMVAGQSGNGKSTAVKALLRGWERSPTPMPFHPDIPKTEKISLMGQYHYKDDESNTFIHVSVYDTPGYGDTMNNAEAIEPIAQWVHSKLTNQYEAERSVQGTAEDCQIHCCLYFIPPQRIHEVDKDFMRRLQQEVPLIPLVAKADTLTNQELVHQREEVTRVLREGLINWYNFDDQLQHVNLHVHDEPLQSRWGPDSALGGRGRRVGQPLAIIARDGEYPWGRSSVMNPEHSDFLELQDQLLRIHPKRLIDQAHVKYQEFRAHLVKQEKQAAQGDRTTKRLVFLFSAIALAAAAILPRVGKMHQSASGDVTGLPPEFYLPFPGDRSILLGSQPTRMFSEHEEAVRGISPSDKTWILLNASVDNGTLQLSPQCTTNMTNVFELMAPPTDHRLQLAGIPSSLNRCLKELRVQHVLEHRHGEACVIFTWIVSGQAASKEILVKLRAAAEAEHTMVQGDGIQPGLPALSATDLTITGYDGLGLRRHVGGDTCTVDIRGRFAKGSPMQNMTIATNDNGDGTYTALFMIPHGEYTVSVRMNGRLVLPIHTVKASDPEVEVENMQIRSELEKLRLSHRNLTMSLGQTSESAERLTVQMEHTDTQMSELFNRLNSTERAKQSLEFDTNRTIGDLIMKVRAAAHELNATKTDLANSMASGDSCQTDLAEKRLQFGNCSEQLRSSEAMVLQVEGDVRQVRGEMAKLKVELNKKTKESDSLEMDNTNLIKELKDCQAKDAVFERAKAELGGCKQDLDHALKMQEEQRQHEEALRMNKPPTVRAGGDLEVTVEEGFVLQATATDPEGHPLTYSWSMIQGAEPSILEGNWSSSTLKANFSGLGVHTFKVTVNDSLGGVHSDIVNVHVRPKVGVGIDLGTTYSCISLSDKGKPTAWMADPEHGLLCMPSVVCFSGKGKLVGQEALESRDCEPQYLISEAKRLMGLRRDDPAVAFQRESVHYRIDNSTVSGMVDSAHVTVREQDGWMRSGSETLLLPEEISAMILDRLWDVCSKEIGPQACRHAVVTAPAQFSDGQRKATKDAIKLSKWELIKILPEPTAAAFGFGILQNLDPSKLYYILVGDLGGGTYDCTLLQVKHKSFKVLATGGDNHFGGKDFDRCLARRLTADLRHKYGTFQESQKLQHRISLEAERAKRTLSEKNAADVHVKGDDGTVFQTTLTRSDFETECADLFNRIPEILLEVLSDRRLTPGDVNIMLPVGGSSRMPRARQLYAETFPTATIPDFTGAFDPEMAVVNGAALVAEYVVKDPGALPMDVTPLSLGVPELKPISTGAGRGKTASGVTLSVFSESDQLSADVHTFHVGVQVLPPLTTTSVNPVQNAVNIFMVIDVSGSMSGFDAGRSVKLESVKRAVLAIVDRLPEEAKLFICTFSTGACEEKLALASMDAPGKASARTLLKDLRHRGSTNMKRGVEEAIQEIHRAANEEGLSQAALMLLTDGQPNRGDTSYDLIKTAAFRFRQREVSMVASTIGFGNPNTNDLNGHLLNQLAEVGGGHYYYAQDGAVVDQIMTEIIQDAKQTLGRQVKLDVMATAGFKFSSSFPESCVLNTGGTQVSCDLKDISTFQQEILLELDGSGRTYNQAVTGTVQVLDATLSYLISSGSQPVREDTTTSLKVAETPGSPALMVGNPYQEQLCQMKTRRLLKQQKNAEAKAQAGLCQDPQLRANVQELQGLRDEERYSRVSIIDKKNLAGAAEASFLREQICVLIPRHSLYPTRRSITKQTYQDGQTEVSIRVYEGEGEYPKQNHLLGEFMLSGIPPMAAGQADIEITFELDNDGTLAVQGACKQGGSSQGIKLNVATKDGRLKEEDLDALRANLKKFG